MARSYRPIDRHLYNRHRLYRKSITFTRKQIPRLIELGRVRGHQLTLTTHARTRIFMINRDNEAIKNTASKKVNYLTGLRGALSLGLRFVRDSTRLRRRYYRVFFFYRRNVLCLIGLIRERPLIVIGWIIYGWCRAV